MNASSANGNTRKARQRSRRGTEGFVTAEIAFGLLGLAAAAYVLVGLFAVVIMKIRCVDAVAEMARQAARGDTAAVALVRDGLPAAATATSREDGDTVRVHLDVPMSPWGSWLGAITVSADAETLRERTR
ncbi:MAG: hypothetical protein LBI84_06440 [Propionibacteriaceae bacterium]|nr:hypothetical protein [Propionibacteriaceae bacterium]